MLELVVTSAGHKAPDLMVSSAKPAYGKAYNNNIINLIKLLEGKDNSEKEGIPLYKLIRETNKLGENKHLTMSDMIKIVNDCLGYRLVKIEGKPEPEKEIGIKIVMHAPSKLSFGSSWSGSKDDLKPHQKVLLGLSDNSQPRHGIVSKIKHITRHKYHKSQKHSSGSEVIHTK